MEIVVLSPAQLENIINRAVAAALESTAVNVTSAAKAATNLLTIRETAKRLRKSEKTIREYIKLGVLPAVNANRGTTLRPSYSVIEADVNAYVKRLRV